MKYKAYWQSPVIDILKKARPPPGKNHFRSPFTTVAPPVKRVARDAGSKPALLGCSLKTLAFSLRPWEACPRQSCLFEHSIGYIPLPK